MTDEAEDPTELVAVDDSPITLRDVKRAPVPVELRQKWKRLVNKNPPENQLRAIYRAAVLGETWKAAARAEGMKLANLWKHARNAGLAHRDRDGQREGHARIVGLAQDALEEKLLKARVDARPKELAYVMDIAAKHANVADAEPLSTFASVLDQMARSLESGGAAELTLRVTKAEDSESREMLDVTPISSVASPSCATLDATEAPSQEPDRAPA